MNKQYYRISQSTSLEFVYSVSTYAHESFDWCIDLSLFPFILVTQS